MNMYCKLCLTLGTVIGGIALFKGRKEINNIIRGRKYEIIEDGQKASEENIIDAEFIIRN